jgi:hypothetical protein
MLIEKMVRPLDLDQAIGIAHGEDRRNGMELGTQRVVGNALDGLPVFFGVALSFSLTSAGAWGVGFGLGGGRLLLSGAGTAALGRKAPQSPDPLQPNYDRQQPRFRSSHAHNEPR